MRQNRRSRRCLRNVALDCARSILMPTPHCTNVTTLMCRCFSSRTVKLPSIASISINSGASFWKRASILEITSELRFCGPVLVRLAARLDSDFAVGNVAGPALDAVIFGYLARRAQRLVVVGGHAKCVTQL